MKKINLFLFFFALSASSATAQKFFYLIQKAESEQDARIREIEITPIPGYVLAGEDSNGNTLWAFPIKKIIFFYSYLYRGGFFSVELVGAKCPYEFSLEKGGQFIIPQMLGEKKVWSSTRQINPQTTGVKIKKE
jgi:hypothetical protein